MNKKSVILKCSAACAYLIATGMANASVSEDSSAPAFRLGGATVYPGLSIVEKSDSNIARATANPQSSLVTVITPSVVLRARKGADTYSLTYRIGAGRYSRSAIDNYVDHDFAGAAEVAIASRATVRLTPSYQLGHDDRGSVPGLAAAAIPNTYRNTGVAGSFAYGSEESRGRFVVDVGYSDKQYTNNRSGLSTTTAFDKYLHDFGGAFYFRALPKVSTFVQVTDTGISYKDPASTLNGSEQRYLVGVTWDATAQTSGSFKIGGLRKKFDSATRSTFNGTSWEGAVRWSPREYARIDFISSRKPSDSTGIGDLVLIDNNALDFGYDFSERTSLHFNASSLNEDFRGGGRVDDTSTYGLKAEYKFQSWLVGGVEYTDATKTSVAPVGTPTGSYKRNIFAVNLRSEL